MKKWMGLVLAILVVFNAGVAEAQKKASAPSLKVGCNVIAAEIKITSHLPSGDKCSPIGRKPVTLKKGQRYTLAVSMPGYDLYKKSFSADWSGLKEKSVVLEKGIGPEGNKAWVADLEDGIEMEFMPIPAGEFIMGSHEGEEDEQPVHRVVFAKPFWMAKTEVTNQQYEQFKALDHKPFENEMEMPTGAEYPVCWINWADASAFCKWLTQKERRRGRLPEGYEYTLPTEAEWEYACRAETTTEYAGSLDSMAWYNKNSAGKTNPVGQKKPNAWGLYDMHGNVWEWCDDYWYGSYTDAPEDGSQRGDALGEYSVDRSQWNEEGHVRRLYSSNHRAVRGGSWHYSSAACRSANRYYHTPDYELNYLGFRPVLLWNPPHLKVKVTNRPKKEEP